MPMPKAAGLLILLLLSHFGWAQKPFEGRIHYDITYDQVSEEMQGVDRMLPDRMTWIIFGGYSRIEYRFQLGGSYTIIHWEESDTLYMLAEFPQQRVYTTRLIQRPNQLKMMGDQAVRAECAGHPVSLYLIQSPYGLDSAWCSLKFQNPKGGDLPLLTYLPLEYEAERNGLHMHLKATRMQEEPVDDTYFTIPTDYVRVSREVYDAMLR